MPLYDYQLKGKTEVSYAWKKNIKSVVLCIPTGGGKCLALNTPVMMYDGSIKMVQDIVVGELLMGPDSTPRTVLSTCTGSEEMFDVIPTKGEKYTANRSHILSLKRTDNKKNIDISIDDYLNQSKTFKHCAKGYRTAIDFKTEENLKIDPYFLGLWLADGSSNNISFCFHNDDLEVIQYVRNMARFYNCHVREQYNSENSKMYFFTDDALTGRGGSFKNKEFDHYNLFDNKHIPFCYKTSSRESRLALLAGILDGDAHMSHNGFCLTMKDEAFIDDVKFIARSVGLAAYKSKVIKGIKATGFKGTYWSLSISGDCDIIPTLLPRKKAQARRQKKNVLVYGFKLVSIGIGNYYGFEIDGDHRFVLGDFTVTHNTITFSDIAYDALKAGWPTMVLLDRTELMEQADEALKERGLHAVIIDPKYRGKTSMLYVASVDTLRNRKFPDIKLLIIDECHMRTFDPIVLHYKSLGVYIIGVTATPVRAGKKFLKKGTTLEAKYPEYCGHMGNVYDKIITPVTISELIEREFLVPCLMYGPPIDLSDVKVRSNDYDEASLFAKFDKPKLYSNVVDNYIKFAEGTKALCFNINVEHSKKMCEEFCLRGIPSAHLDGNTPKDERRRILKDFASGLIQVLCNCGVLIKGYNLRNLETVILNRATMSLPTYLQMLGRGSRTCPQINKAYFICIDQGNHTPRLGRYEDERTYSLDKKFSTKSIGVAPTKKCENCEAILPASAVLCKWCDTAQKKKDDKKLQDAEFILLEQKASKPLYKMNISELEKFRVEKKYALGWIVHQLMPRGREALEEYAVMKGYQKAWVNIQMEAATEKRIESKKELFAFMNANPHLENSFVEKHARKLLKKTHNETEIEALVPNILEAMEKIKLKLVKE